MNKNFLFLVSVSVAVSACASGPRPPADSPAELAECARLSDSLARHTSTDSLPLARFIAKPRVLPAPALRPGDSLAVEFLVRPDGLADINSVEITGPKDPAFVRSVLRLLTESRFMPAQVRGCKVLSRYNLIVKPAA
jgi:hypothetical protein